MKALKIHFWITASSILLGLLFRIPFAGGGILLADILLPLFAFHFLSYKILYQKSLPSSSFLFCGVLFSLWAFITWLFNAWDLELKAQILSISYLIRWISFLIFGLAAKELFAPQKVINGFWYLFLLVVVGGFLQFYFIPDISEYSTVGGFDPHIGRLLSTWMDPNFFGGMAGWFLPFLAANIYTSKKISQKLFWSVNFLLLLFALFLTFSRSSYLAAAVGLGVFFLLKDPKVLLIGAFLAVIAIASNPRAQKRLQEFQGTLAAVILQDTDEIDPTAKLRIQSWQNTLSLWEKYPLMGIGYNTYRYKAAEEGIVNEKYFSSGGSDAALLTILVTTGIIGLLLFLCFWGKIFFTYLYHFFTRQETLSLAIISAMISITLHSTFVNALLFPLIFMPVSAILFASEKTLKS